MKKKKMKNLKIKTRKTKTINYNKARLSCYSTSLPFSWLSSETWKLQTSGGSSDNNFYLFRFLLKLFIFDFFLLTFFADFFVTFFRLFTFKLKRLQKKIRIHFEGPYRTMSYKNMFRLISLHNRVCKKRQQTSTSSKANVDFCYQEKTSFSWLPRKKNVSTHESFCLRFKFSISFVDKMISGNKK